MPRGRRKASAQCLSGMSEPHRIRFYTRSSSRNGDLHSRMRFLTVHCLPSCFFVVIICYETPNRSICSATISRLAPSGWQRYDRSYPLLCDDTFNRSIQLPLCHRIIGRSSAFPLSIRCRASAAEADPVLARAAAPGPCLIRMCGASCDLAAHLSARRIFFRDSISGVFVARCQVYIG